MRFHPIPTQRFSLGAAAPMILADVSRRWDALLALNDLFSMTETLRIIQDGYIFAPGTHERCVARIGDIEAGKVGVAHHEQPPRIVTFVLARDLLGVRSRIDRC